MINNGDGIGLVIYSIGYDWNTALSKISTALITMIFIMQTMGTQYFQLIGVLTVARESNTHFLMNSVTQFVLMNKLQQPTPPMIE